MTVFIRYCGGCNPEYDRVAQVRALGNASGWEIRNGQPEPGGVCLLVSGCRRRCIKGETDACLYIPIDSAQSPRELMDLIEKEIATR